MHEYYVEKGANETGEHIVHLASCSSLPAKDNLYYIGVRSTSAAPLKEAANWFSKSTLCPECIAS
jgi:hypothetical protein